MEKKKELVDLMREIRDNSRPMTNWERKAAAEFFWSEFKDAEGAQKVDVRVPDGHETAGRSDETLGA